ncbi:MAG: beta-hydroxyacyl-ACP dehydratase [Defluviitaleaceae bacterium]|nr:beta-hydroxyacyl-ACP dehydratase [Defluviitaleaceae bacterium]
MENQREERGRPIFNGDLCAQRMAKKMDKTEIKKILPHRESMLLIDEAELQDGISESKVSVAKYTVRGDEFFLQGHFPGNPVVPGVILCEMMAQSACLLVDANDNENCTPFFTSMDKVKFKSKVVPGDCVIFKSEVVRQKSIFYFVKSAGYVNDVLCVTGELSFALVKNEQ